MDAAAAVGIRSLSSAVLWRRRDGAGWAAVAYLADAAPAPPAGAGEVSGVFSARGGRGLTCAEAEASHFGEGESWGCKRPWVAELMRGYLWGGC